jgi:hypothetical protein
MQTKHFFQLVGCWLTFSFFLTVTLSAQDIFSSKTKITWLGCDFTGMKYFGDAGTVSEREIVLNTEKINNVIVAEGKKYNFAEAFKRMTVETDLTMVNDLNSNMAPDDLITMKSSELQRWKKEDIEKAVAGYPLKGAAGEVGLVFIVEGLDKSNEKGYMWVTFVNMDSKKVLFTERLAGKAQGFGFRNHWAYCVYDILKQIKSTKYKAWSGAKGKK